MTDAERLARAEAALRWIFRNGLKHSTERPQLVADAIDDAFACVRAENQLQPDATSRATLWL